MLRKIFWISGSCLLVFGSACRQAGKNNFEVDVSFTNADKFMASSASPRTNQAYLEEVPYGKDQPPVTLDSAKLQQNNGSFVLTGKGDPGNVYEVVFGDNALLVPLINDMKQIKVNIDLSKRDEYYDVSGSDASKGLQDFISEFGKKNTAIEKSFADLDSLKHANATDSVVIAATQAKNNAIDDLNNYLKQFISSAKHPTLGILALGWASRSLSGEDFEASMDGLQKKYPDNAILRSMKTSFEAQKAQQQEMDNKEKENSWVGKPAPALSLPDVNGKTVSLASFKGKYVLVDFWASWCGPCRMENPNVVKAYQEFKDKNFTVLGVSLDKDKDAWQQAIRQDKLTWTHISDLKYWNSAAVDIFKFGGIPFNVLVDPDGRIIAQELRGDNLENKLKEVLQ